MKKSNRGYLNDFSYFFPITVHTQNHNFNNKVNIRLAVARLITHVHEKHRRIIVQ